MPSFLIMKIDYSIDSKISILILIFKCKLI